VNKLAIFSYILSVFYTACTKNKHLLLEEISFPQRKASQRRSDNKEIHLNTGSVEAKKRSIQAKLWKN